MISSQLKKRSKNKTYKSDSLKKKKKKLETAVSFCMFSNNTAEVMGVLKTTTGASALFQHTHKSNMCREEHEGVELEFALSYKRLYSHSF